jgi:acyl-CoA reductase-like NAD-dependent aldehyde dehydrogenase
MTFRQCFIEHAMPELMRLTSFVGAAVLPHDGAVLPLVRPGDGEVVFAVVEADDEVVDTAAKSARHAFEVNRNSSLHQRSEWLRAASAALKEESKRVAAFISEDIGKPIRVAQIEVRRGAEFLDACAAAALNIGGEVVPVDAAANGVNHFGFTRRVPYGVVGAVTPFNAPVNLLIQKVAPAIAAGNAVVAKPAPSGTRVALFLAEVFCKHGWPPGLFNVVTGDRAAAMAIAKNPIVSAVSFTGGTAAGQALAQAAGIKKFVAELGSNAANIVMADADVVEAARKIAAAAFEASGQQCISAQRVLVEAPVLDKFVEEFVAAAAKLRVGPADDPKVDLGPMVHRAAADRVMRMCQDAIDRGARFALQPKQDSCIVSPAILLDVPDAAELWQHEVFGPVALVKSFNGVEEGICLANDSPFGLQGAVFTSSLATAMRFSADFDVGSLWINEASRYRLDMYPFGGMKQSGTGREGVRYAIEELSQIKFTGIKL